MFFTAALIIGYAIAAFMVGDEFAILFNQPLRLAGLTILAGMAGAVGW